MAFSTQTQYLEYFPEVRDQRWLFFCAWYIIYCFYVCTLQGPGTKKGFVCVFATSCEISFRDIPKIIRVSNNIPWPNICKILFVNKKICPEDGPIISNSFGTKFSCAEHRILKLGLKTWLQAISVDASHWSAYESGIADFCNPVSWENHGWGPVWCVFFWLREHGEKIVRIDKLGICETWRKIMRIILEERSALFTFMALYIYFFILDKLQWKSCLTWKKQHFSKAIFLSSIFRGELLVLGRVQSGPSSVLDRVITPFLRVITVTHLQGHL